MRFLTILTLLTIFAFPSYAQVTTIEVPLTEKIHKDKRPVYFSTSDDGEILYGFMPLQNERRSYQLYAFNDKFEIIEKLAKVDIGGFADFRDIYVHDEDIISVRTYEEYDLLGLSGRYFYLTKASIRNPNYAKDIDINLGRKEIVIGTKQYGHTYYLFTLNKKGLIQMYTIDVTSMEYTTKEIEGNYQSSYQYVEGLFSTGIGFAQIDTDKYYDLQAASAKLKSYFEGEEYVFEIVFGGINILTFVNLETGKIRKKSFGQFAPNRTAIMYEGKYYVSSAGSYSMNLKIFDVESKNLITEYSCNRKDNSIPFQSTKIIDQGYAIEPKAFIRKLGKSNKIAKSYGLLPQRIDSTVILTLGMPYYNTSSSYMYTGTGGGSYTTNSGKYSYTYNKIGSRYSEVMTVEAWINPDGTTIPFQADNKYKSPYKKLEKLIQFYGSKRDFSKLSVFKFKGEWYFGVYDEKKEEYLIFLM